MSVNKNYLQKMRTANLDQVKRFVALHMPKGLDDKTFRALCMYELGVTKRRLKEYIEILVDLGQIECVGYKTENGQVTGGKWKIVLQKD